MKNKTSLKKIKFNGNKSSEDLFCYVGVYTVKDKEDKNIALFVQDLKDKQLTGRKMTNFMENAIKSFEKNNNVKIDDYIQLNINSVLSENPVLTKIIINGNTETEFEVEFDVAIYDLGESLGLDVGKIVKEFEDSKKK